MSDVEVDLKLSLAASLLKTLKTKIKTCETNAKCQDLYLEAQNYKRIREAVDNIIHQIEA